MQLISYPSPSEWPALLRRPAQDFDRVEPTVAPILQRVRSEGDRAVRDFSRAFDQVHLEDFRVEEETLRAAGSHLSEELKRAIGLAKANLTVFHAAQRGTTERIETMPGVVCWRKSVGIEKVGLYIPGGTAPLFSTVLMLGVPAQLAGCREVILCTPAGKSGIHPAILYAAHLVGIRHVFAVGGAQAIAAMAYGTETVPKVHKIFGPGNQYVTTAKQLVSKEGTAIDMPAGPSEVAVYADDTAVPAFVAADLLSQAEHGVDSQVILVSESAALIGLVREEVEKQLAPLPRRNIAAQALVNSKAILVRNQEEAIDLLNEYAAEHLILAVRNAEAVGERIVNAGSIFLGNYSPEAAGDYASGTNHTLPTNGFAKAYSGVSLDSFVKKITFQQISPRGLRGIGPAVEAMAEAESLGAHKEAVSVRLRSMDQLSTENGQGEAGNGLGAVENAQADLSSPPLSVNDEPQPTATNNDQRPTINQQRLTFVIRPHILRLAPYSSARDEYSGKEGVFLDANENPLGSVTAAAFNRYPDPYQWAVKEKLAAIKGVRPAQIFLGNGSD
ncbi:MAG: histidinol dehydrogenase, partial [Ferruginibacter sp.]|nr:histidinol dehydrogenase [Cytophagales bacterium]